MVCLPPYDLKFSTSMRLMRGRCGCCDGMGDDGSGDPDSLDCDGPCDMPCDRRWRANFAGALACAHSFYNTASGNTRLL